ncbi:DUF2523 family protein [Psychrobacter sp.]|uniref:DUF2523 family protein n=1 Tax=Psychrobacter sp. TaxID=56811 RepID=UPI003C736214
MSLSSLLSKSLDSASSGFLKKLLTGAGLGIASTAGVTVLINQYIDNLRTSTGGLSVELLAILNLAGVDFVISIILSAVVTRIALNSANLSLTKLSK